MFDAKSKWRWNLACQSRCQPHEFFANSIGGIAGILPVCAKARGGRQSGAKASGGRQSTDSSTIRGRAIRGLTSPARQKMSCRAIGGLTSPARQKMSCRAIRGLTSTARRESLNGSGILPACYMSSLE